MPLIKTINEQFYRIFIWEFQDSETDYLLEFWEETDKNKAYAFSKKMEYCMIRALLKQELPEHKIAYKPDSSPYLIPNKHFISISHSFPYACIALGNQPIGVDLEKVKEKIIKLRHKFVLNESDFIEKEFEKEYLTVIWSVKEALYKVHPSNLWSLKKHYDLSEFSIKKPKDIACTIYTNDWKHEFIAQVYGIHEMYLSIVYDSGK